MPPGTENHFHGTERLVTTRKWWVFLIFIVVFTQSCFSFKTLYSWADSHFSSKIDEWFDLTREQDQFVDRQLVELFKHHRQFEIPKYARFLEEINRRLDRSLTCRDIEWFRLQLKQFNSNIANLLAEDAATLLFDLQENQVRHLQKKMEEYNEDRLEEYGIRDDNGRKKRMEDRLDRIRDWLGDVTDEQKTFIRKHYPPGEDSYQIRFRHRLKSQERFLRIINHRTTRQKLKTQLLHWYLNPEETYSEEYRNYRQARDLEAEKLILFLDQTATPEQRKHLKRKLEEYIMQLEDLIKDYPPPDTISLANR